MITCARCNQPIKFRELYHQATRAAEIGSPGTGIIHGVHASAVVPGETVLVHVYPCPTRIGPPDRYAEDSNPTCCGGGPQWGHAFDCPSLP